MLRKTSPDSLAIFGGASLFDRVRPIGQLDMPDIDAFLAELRQVFERRHLTNGGPLTLALEQRLAAYHGTRHCVALANAGMGITMLLQLFANGRHGEVIMPAFSYRGLPHFAVWAGQLPRFCDVDARSHALDPAAVEAAIGARTTAILAVCNAHDPGDIDGLCAVAARHGVPILFDSVYALGASHRGRRLGASGDAEVYSLHATKLLNGFEGGYVTTNDDGLAERLRWQRNFALPGLRPATLDPQAQVLGLNAKLNEVHAAMALLGLEQIDTLIARNRARFHAWRDCLAQVPGLRLLGADCETGNYGLAIAEVLPCWPLGRDCTVALLRAEGLGIGPYYSPPLHLSEHAPPGLEPRALPVAEDLAGRFFQLPVGALVSLEDIAAIGELLRFVADGGAAIARRLAERAPA